MNRRHLPAQWRHLLVWMGIVALLAGAMVNFGYIQELGRLLTHVNWYILFFVVLAQAASYLANARYYQTVLKIFGHKLPLKDLYEISLAINFVNQVFPTGGISGATYLSRELHGEVPVGKATLVQLMRYIFTFLAYLAVLVIGFLFLFLGDDLQRVSLRLALLLMLVIIIGSLLILAIVSDRSKMSRLLKFGVTLVNRVGRIFGGKRKLITDEKIKRFLDEFYRGYAMLLENKRAWARPLFWCLVGSLFEVTTIYIVFLAFGQVVNPGIVIAAYTIANLASLLSFYSGGIGFYEGGMAATLAFLGIPFATSLSVTIFYRAFNFVLFLPLGFYFYHKRV
jgi:uncharacterized protein (TIRG00374 family)